MSNRPAPEPQDRLREMVDQLWLRLGIFGGMDSSQAKVYRDQFNAEIHAALVRIVAEEREACARYAETPSGNYQVGVNPVPYWDGAKIARAIRARGLKE